MAEDSKWLTRLGASGSLPRFILFTSHSFIRNRPFTTHKAGVEVRVYCAPTGRSVTELENVVLTHVRGQSDSGSRRF